MIILFIILIVILWLKLIVNTHKETYINDEIKFIHIGKCGGTYFNNNLSNFKEYHMNRNYDPNDTKYMIWIRNPMKRFVSAFLMSYDAINTDITNLKIEDVTLDTYIAPDIIRETIKNKRKYFFSERCDYLINYFKNPNNLAEALDSKNTERKKLSHELMNMGGGDGLEQWRTPGHIYKGIGWYLYNGDFIEKNHDKIIFVGTLENMDEDILRLQRKINKKIETHDETKRKNKNHHDKHLSERAIRNLKEFYKDTDYKALEKLNEYGFISNEILEDYNNYN